MSDELSVCDRSAAARLRRVADLLADVPVDADEALLFERVAPELVPALGRWAALLVAGADGRVRLAAVAGDGPADALRDTVARRLADLGAAAVATDPPPVDHAQAAAGDPTGGPTDVVGASLADFRRGLRAAPPGWASAEVPAASGAAPDAVLLLLAADAPPGDAGSVDPADPPADLADQLGVVGALLGAARAVRSSRRLAAVALERLGQNVRDGRELAHRLNNDLTMPVGVVELILDRAGLAPDLHEMLQAAAEDLAALERHIRDFHDSMRSQAEPVGEP